MNNHKNLISGSPVVGVLPPPPPLRVIRLALDKIATLPVADNVRIIHALLSVISTPPPTFIYYALPAVVHAIMVNVSVPDIICTPIPADMDFS